MYLEILFIVWGCRLSFTKIEEGKWIMEGLEANASLLPGEVKQDQLIAPDVHGHFAGVVNGIACYWFHPKASAVVHCTREFESHRCRLFFTPRKEILSRLDPNAHHVAES